MENPELELELIRRAQQGDLRAYGALVKRYEERMFYTAHRILHQREDAEDCLQETFLRVWDRLRELSDVRAFQLWVYRILSNQALDILRRRERQREGLESYGSEVLHLARVSSPASPRELLRRSREVERIERAIEELPPRQKLVFVLRHFQGLKLTEIAEVLNSPLGTVKATLHNALQKLQGSLIGSGEVDERARR